MATIHQMLAMNGGSFARAEQMALDLITKGGDHKVWLDLCLLLHAQGKFDGARQALTEYAKVFPGCPRMHFARAPFQLRDGDLKGGLVSLEAGRAINCFGDNGAMFGRPPWDGDSPITNKTVVLHGEGGLGDQIMCVRSARWLRDAGAKVVVSCSKPLMKMFSRLQGVQAVVSNDAVHNVYYDAWVPMLSSFRITKRTWENIWPGVYVQKPENVLWERIVPREKGILNVGLRWRGNPKFEHEQLRAFPPELMFKLASLKSVRFWSLQKDESAGILPSNVTDLEPFLGDWEQTAAAISRMDLVITSCTAVVHLAGAMGCPAWVVVPVMPYYPWARPGSTSAWYPSVTIYRQECFGTWEKPFAKLHDDLRQKCAG